MYCLWCHNGIIPELSWKNLLVLQEQQMLCNLCLKQLDLINGKRCNLCSRQSQLQICLDCKRWEENPLLHHALDFNYSIYTYNELMQEIIAKWKYRGDYTLAAIFKTAFVQVFKEKFRDYLANSLIVPIPLSKERRLSRGFNQAETLANFLPNSSTKILSRVHNEKQSKKTRYERITTANPFIIHERVNKPVILVDDIYTTGTTVRHAGLLLKEHGCPNVYAYTLVRG